MIGSIVTSLILFGILYGLYWWNRERKKVSVIGQAAYLYATTHPEKWEFSSCHGWSCGKFQVNKLKYSSTTPRINNINVKQHEHQRVVNFLENWKGLRKKEREDKKAKELMDFALSEAKKKLEEITNEREGQRLL